MEHTTSITHHFEMKSVKSMRKLLVAIFVLTMLLTACGGGSGGGGNGGGTTNSSPTKDSNWDQLTWDKDNWT